MITLSYSSGDVDEVLVNEQIQEFAGRTDELRRALEFLSSAPPVLQEQARALDPRLRVLDWARRRQSSAWEGADLAAQVLSEVEQILSPFWGPSPQLADVVAELQEEAQSTQDWLDMRREEHPTWVPGLTGYLVGLLGDAQRVLGEALTDWEKRRIAATVEAVPVIDVIGRGIVEIAPRDLRDLSPDEFEFLVAEWLDAMGLEPTRLGHVYAPDAGIDIIAVPRITAIPLILAVQVKHHRGFRKTTAPDVRNFVGAIELHRLFSAGMLVTNTSFTPDARWIAEHARKLVLLRDEEDLRRWIKGEFLRAVEWREIPTVVELGRGIRVTIPRGGDTR